MIVNFNELEIIRARMHRIHPKQKGFCEEAQAEYISDILVLNDDIKEIIRDRLVSSFGNQSKAFELSIVKYDENSCFDYLKKLNDASEELFFDVSKELADILAESQGTKRIPGGYLLLLDCRKYDRLPLYVLIKAETQSAISVNQSHTEALKNLILSPAQKLYKAAIFEQVNETLNDLTPKNFKCYLFDSQFNDGSKLASYFYKDFLGLSIMDNAPLMTKQFYEMFNSTIDKEFKNDAELANKCKDGLIATLNNQLPVLNPQEVINEVIPYEKRDAFINDVVDNCPNSFSKDVKLIERSISRKSIYLTNGVRLYAPVDSFDKIITIETDPNDSNVKVVKVRVTDDRS